MRLYLCRSSICQAMADLRLPSPSLMRVKTRLPLPQQRRWIKRPASTVVRVGRACGRLTLIKAISSPAQCFAEYYVACRAMHHIRISHFAMCGLARERRC